MTNQVGPLFGIYPDTRSHESDESIIDSDVQVGIELELEDVSDLSMYSSTFLRENNWIWEHDHSLRGTCCELISSCDGKPIKGYDVGVALEALDQSIAKLKSLGRRLPSVGPRTSTHIHVDVSDLTPKQLANFLLYYVMFEETILNSESPERVGNNYCLPISKSSDLKDNLSTLIKSDFSADALRTIVQYWPKYSALNLQSLRTLGTAEFRVFPGCYDGGTVKRWINTLLSIRKAAVKGTFDLMKLPETISGQGFDRILDQVFPEDIAERFKKTLEPRTMLRGARNVQSILLQHAAHNRAAYLPGKPSAYSKSFKNFLEVSC